MKRGRGRKRVNIYYSKNKKTREQREGEEDQG
jgi:hypothetical protein